MHSTTYADTLRAQRVDASDVAAGRVAASTLARLGGGAQVVQSVPAPNDGSSVVVEGNGMSGVIRARYAPALASEPVKMTLTLPAESRPESVVLQANGRFPSGTPSVPLSATIVDISNNALTLRVDDTTGASEVTIHYLASERRQG